MQYKILVVEDEEFIRDGLQESLEMEDYIVEVAGDGEEALLKADDFLPNMVLLDVMMPRKNGFDVCRALRKKYPSMIIIMLTAKGEEASKVTGLNIGADDYVTKPFSTLELLARVNAFFRKLAILESPIVFGTEVAEFSGIKLDFKKYEATKNGEFLDLNAREFQILNLFYRRRGEVISREELMKLIKTDNNEKSRTIDNYVVKLRQKIENEPENPKLIISIRGMGYKLDA
ncbi:MAG: response regulator transcription factor [Fibromonadaceae bacterium]|jgi:DNA-binding response OmpR family regulator|nr:response regulator transcription factor [Fibromonadaceae bacterium]